MCLDIAFVVSSLWNWTLLWKPTIDALCAALEQSDPVSPEASRDARPVWLGLHRTIDKHMGGDVLIQAWWSDGAIRTKLA